MKSTLRFSFLKFAAITLSCGIFQTQASGNIESNKLGYFRTPSIHDNIVVFAAEDDLWRVNSTNYNVKNEAVRLTTHSAEEKDPFISPDGKYVAFTANYEGSDQVYLTTIKGGAPRRVSFENSRAMVKGWTKSGDIIYATATTITGPANSWVLKTVNPLTMSVNEIQVSDAVEGVIDENNNHIFFVQHGLQITGDNANQYKGGAKGELWRFNLNNSDEAVKLTAQHDGSIKNPMLFDNRVYFISNKSGIDNLWSMSLLGEDAKPVTKYTDWGVRSATLYNGKIAYQLGADIIILDLVQNSSNKLNIELTSDFPQLRERWIETPLNFLTNTALAAKADKVVLTARGKIAVAGIDSKRLIELETSPTSRSRNAILSNDGKSVFTFNDAGGESEIWQFWLDKQTPAKQLTRDGKTARLAMWLTPDGTKIAHYTKHGELFLLDIESGKNTLLFNEISLGSVELRWFSDSDTFAIAYSKVGNERAAVELHSLSQDKSVVLTSQKYASYSPSFSHDGSWLYFLSDRNFNADSSSPWGDRNMGVTFDKTTQIYAIALNDTAEFPFKEPQEGLTNLTEETDEKNNEKSDEDDTVEDDTKEDDKTASDEGASIHAEKKSIDIVWEGITKRLWKVPVEAGNYSRLSANAGFLYVIDAVNQPNVMPSLKSIKIKHDALPRTFTSSVNDYQLSNDGKSVLIQKGRRGSTSMYIVAAGSMFPNDSRKSRVQTRDWKLRVNPQNEWRQLFKDAWMMHRDSLFDADMRGVDWLAAKAKYEPLLSRLTGRRELNDIFKQMMGELNTLHSQVRGGDIVGNDELASTSTLGAVFTDSEQGVLISHIYLHDPELPAEASPLASPGVNAANGDIIKAVNNNLVESSAQLIKQLTYQSGKQVLLTLERDGKQFNTIVEPTSHRNERRYRYRNWVSANANKVNLANNDIGYLHLYAMTGRDLSTFAKEFYAQYKKQGLIIDVRRNNGGNIDSIIIEKLLRRAWSFWQYRTGEQVTNMQQAFRGHLVVLADEFTYSDGETFTAGIKALELGTVIGKQTAGAGVWLSGANSVVDGGISRVAEFPVFSMDGRWITEGRGISPDIEVNNMPHATFKGGDAQLDRAISYLQDKMKVQPVPKLKAKPLPTVEAMADDI